MKDPYTGTGDFKRTVMTNNHIPATAMTRNNNHIPATTMTRNNNHIPVTAMTRNNMTLNAVTSDKISRNKEIFSFKQFLLFLVLIGILVIILQGISVAGKSIHSSGRQNPDKYYTSITIQPGDTLWSIAEEYMPEEYADTKEYVEEIMDLNHLHSFKIHAGGSLVIPYYD